MDSRSCIVGIVRQHGRTKRRKKRNRRRFASPRSGPREHDSVFWQRNLLPVWPELPSEWSVPEILCQSTLDRWTTKRFFHAKSWFARSLKTRRAAAEDSRFTGPHAVPASLPKILPGAEEPWQLTPHGWVRAAMTANPEMKSATVKGKPVTVVSFTVRGKYKVIGYVNSDNLLEKVETWMPNPILGDTLIETNYSDYKDFGGVKFPMKILQKDGVFPVLELTVSDVQPNAPVNIEVPRTAQSASPAHVESQKIADGVWYLAGAPDPNSMAVEFKDYVVIITQAVVQEEDPEKLTYLIQQLYSVLKDDNGEQPTRSF